ncbi:Palmitoyltransferase [Sergentomyia squamirostris]
MDQETFFSRSTTISRVLDFAPVVSTWWRPHKNLLFVAWLNNCVGFGNHRYFFLYMVFTAVGSLFIIIFGIGIGYNSLILGDGEGWFETEPLEGHPVRFNISGHALPITEMNEYGEDGLQPVQHNLPVPHELANDAAKHRAIIFMAIINVAVVFALGSLSIWHWKLIGAGETSIEAYINRAETKRLAALGKSYSNPYNFGRKKNWKLFLGLVGGRTWLRHVLLPSTHKPVGTGLTFYTVGQLFHQDDDWP